MGIILDGVFEVVIPSSSSSTSTTSATTPTGAAPAPAPAPTPTAAAGGGVRVALIKSELMGEMSFFEGGLRNADIFAAATPSILAALPFTRITHLQRTHPSLAFKLVAMCSLAAIQKLRNMMPPSAGGSAGQPHHTPAESVLTHKTAATATAAAAAAAAKKATIQAPAPKKLVGFGSAFVPSANSPTTATATATARSAGGRRAVELLYRKRHPRHSVSPTASAAGSGSVSSSLHAKDKAEEVLPDQPPSLKAAAQALVPAPIASPSSLAKVQATTPSALSAASKSRALTLPLRRSTGGSSAHSPRPSPSPSPSSAASASASASASAAAPAPPIDTTHPLTPSSAASALIPAPVLHPTAPSPSSASANLNPNANANANNAGGGVASSPLVHTSSLARKQQQAFASLKDNTEQLKRTVTEKEEVV